MSARPDSYVRCWYGPVFENGLETMKQFKAKLQLKPHLLPKFIKVRPVLCAPEI